MTQPTLRDRLRPLELLGLSAGIAIFVGVVVLASTRELVVSAIFLGVAFVVSLVVTAMLALSLRPTEDDLLDLREQDEESDRGH